MITKEEVLHFQRSWGEGVINIGNMFQNREDYESEAKSFINRLYAYDNEKVLFKPTLAVETQFRLDKIGALSYFVGGNSDFSEDEGFAIKGWKSVKWENTGVKIIDSIAICMGNYFFGMDNNADLKVEYTIVLKKIEGVLKIILHDSHLPYQK